MQRVYRLAAEDLRPVPHAPPVGPQRRFIFREQSRGTSDSHFCWCFVRLGLLICYYLLSAQYTPAETRQFFDERKEQTSGKGALGTKPPNAHANGLGRFLNSVAHNSPSTSSCMCVSALCGLSGSSALIRPAVSLQARQSTSRRCSVRARVPRAPTPTTRCFRRSGWAWWRGTHAWALGPIQRVSQT